MLKNPFQVAVTFAVVALIIKLVVFSMNLQHGDMEKYIFFLYTLILCFTVFFGIRSNKILEGTTTFGQDFRVGARTASYYAILITIITYFYYSNIDVNFFEIKREELISSYPAKINKALTEGSMNISEIKTRIHTDIVNTYTIFTAQFQSMITMFGLVFIGVFYSVLLALLMKKMPGFKTN